MSMAQRYAGYLECEAHHAATPVKAEAMRQAANKLRELDRENAALRHLLSRLLEEESMYDRGDGNAPGHCHEVPGVWDRDNGKKAGKPCAWCALWAEAKATILTPNVELTGAEPPFGAASSDRRERG